MDDGTDGDHDEIVPPVPTCRNPSIVAGSRKQNVFFCFDSDSGSDLDEEPIGCPDRFDRMVHVMGLDAMEFLFGCRDVEQAAQIARASGDHPLSDPERPASWVLSQDVCDIEDGVATFHKDSEIRRHLQVAALKICAEPPAPVESSNASSSSSSDSDSDADSDGPPGLVLSSDPGEMWGKDADSDEDMWGKDLDADSDAEEQANVGDGVPLLAKRPEPQPIATPTAESPAAGADMQQRQRPGPQLPEAAAASSKGPAEAESDSSAEPEHDTHVPYGLVDEPLRPSWSHDIHWWAQPVWDAFLPRRMKVRPRRKLLLEMLCVGSGPDIEVADAMGWDYEILAVADCKPVAQKWLKTHWSKQLGHLYDDNHALCQDAGGYCHKHKRCCSCPEPPPDIGASGSPCPPFSAQRQKNGVTNKTSDPTNHPAYSEAMTFFGLWIGQRRPHSWFLEEVGGFDRRLKPWRSIASAGVLQRCSDFGVRGGCVQNQPPIVCESQQTSDLGGGSQQANLWRRTRH